MQNEHLGKILHQISTMNKKQINHKLKQLDLSMSQGLALTWLEEAPNHKLTVKELEKMFETAQPTTLGVINRLEQKGLITTSLSNKRQKVVEITQEGLDMVPPIRGFIQEVEENIFYNFTNGEHAIFMELLRRAKNNISQYYSIDNQEKEFEHE